MSSNSSIDTLASVIRKGIDNRLKDLHTSMPGIVESFDPDTQLARIQPAIKRTFITNEGDIDILSSVNLPLLINVPVQFPRAGGYVITFPVKSGDECLLVFSERSIDLWHDSGEVSKPSSKRFHDLSDALAVLGISSSVNKIENFNADEFEIVKEDGSAKITIKSDGEIEMTTSQLTLNGDLNITGSVTANGKDIGSTHTHTGSATAPTGPITPTGAPL